MPSKQFSTIKLNNKRKVFGCTHSGSVMGFSLPVFSDIDSLSALFPFFFLSGLTATSESQANYQGEGSFFDGSKFPQCR